MDAAAATDQQITTPPGQQPPLSPTDSTVPTVLREGHFDNPGGLDIGEAAMAMYNSGGDDTASVLAANAAPALLAMLDPRSTTSDRSPNSGLTTASSNDIPAGSGAGNDFGIIGPPRLAPHSQMNPFLDSQRDFPNPSSGSGQGNAHLTVLQPVVQANPTTAPVDFNQSMQAIAANAAHAASNLQAVTIVKEAVNGNAAAVESNAAAVAALTSKIGSFGAALATHILESAQSRLALNTRIEAIDSNILQRVDASVESAVQVSVQSAFSHMDANINQVVNASVELALTQFQHQESVPARATHPVDGAGDAPDSVVDLELPACAPPTVDEAGDISTSVVDLEQFPVSSLC